MLCRDYATRYTAVAAKRWHQTKDSSGGIMSGWDHAEARLRRLVQTGEPDGTVTVRWLTGWLSCSASRYKGKQKVKASRRESRVNAEDILRASHSAHSTGARALKCQYDNHLEIQVAGYLNR
jgi:hypothetical protein